jgi:uncharacterized damage-inducible protein DinB
MISMFRMLARYNDWANRRLYAAAAALPEADYRRDAGAFFGSVNGTLNHILVGDRIWMRRFTGEGPTYDRLDLILHDGVRALATEREAEDSRITGWIDSLAADSLDANIAYRMITAPVEIVQPLAPALIHFFNHQTHHRGQVHALITRLGGRDAAPSLDLVLFQRETGLGLAT